MPRIPVRTTPYTTLPRCTRHYKAKRDLILKQLGKATHINGSQFVVAFISPKGEVDAYASELLQGNLTPRDSVTPCIINRPELDRLAISIKADLVRKWADTERQEKLGQAPVVIEDTADLEDDEAVNSRSTSPFDNETTLVGDEIDFKHLINEDALTVKKVEPVSITYNSEASTRVSTPTQEQDRALWPVSMPLCDIEKYYESRFNDIQQNACKLICKNWVKIIEPKKQINHPYNGGEASRPDWWPTLSRHREPDHLSKQGTFVHLPVRTMLTNIERIALLIAILRSPTPGPGRLDLGLSELTVHVDSARRHVIREMLQVRTEEAKLIEAGAGKSHPYIACVHELTVSGPNTVLTIHISHKPITSMDITPETSEKRSGGHMYEQENVQHAPTMNVTDSFADRPMKKMKNTHRPPPLELVQAYANQNPFDSYNWASNGNTPLSGPNPSPAWRDALNLSAPPPHLSPYPHGEWNSAPPTEYVRSPQLDFEVQAPQATSQSKFGSHLAPMSAHQLPSPVDSTFGQAQVGYFPRSHSAAGFLPHQQNDYMQQHQLQQQQLHHYHQQQQYQHQLQQQQQMAQLAPPQPAFDYGSPFVNDWAEQDFTNGA
jgi:hypothetical protein